MGVWIETILAPAPCRRGNDTPHVGVWIETTNPTFTWTKIGICEITFPWDCDSDKCFPTVTTWQGDTGVSARIVSWADKRIITIEIDNDYGSGAGTDRDHDYGGFYIKLEYIG